MASPDLDALIVEHLADIDAASKQLDVINRELFGVMGTIAFNWAKKNGWIGEFEYFEDGLWLAPPDWRVPGSSKAANEVRAWFDIELGAGDTGNLEPEEDYFLTTRLCQVGLGQVGFRFKQDIIKKGAWNKTFKDQASTLSKTAFIADTTLSFFLPIRLDAVQLAQALRDKAPEDAMSPFKEALETLNTAKPQFDAIIKRVTPRRGAA